MQLKYKILESERESYHPYSLDDSFCMDEAANALILDLRYPEDLGTWPHVPPSAGKSCALTPESGQVRSRAISLSVRWISATKAPKPALESVKVGSRSTSVIEGIQSQHWIWTLYSSCQSALNTLEKLELMILWWLKLWILQASQCRVLDNVWEYSVHSVQLRQVTHKSHTPPRPS